MRRRARTWLRILVLLVASGCQDDSLPPAGPPPGGPPPPGGNPGGNDAGTDMTSGDASVPGCEEVDANDDVTLTAFVGSAPSFEPVHVIAAWVCDGTDAQLQIALTTTSCRTGSGDRLVVATTASAIDDGVVSPGVPLALGTSPYVSALLSVGGNAWPTCIESSGTVTFDQVDTAAGDVEVNLDVTLTDCLAGALPTLSVVGSFDATLTESRAVACP